MSDRAPPLVWVVLTVGNRPAELEVALDSIEADNSSSGVTVLHNGTETDCDLGSRRPGIREVTALTNLGIPGGRDLALRGTSGPIIAFLDDDAALRSPAAEQIVRAFSEDRSLGAIAFRIVDEDGLTARRHVPRVGGGEPTVAGDVALFLGGACAVRRSAYEAVGGYWSELFYGHEELELSWRLIDAGWRIHYLPEIEVFHPRTEISRHAGGWSLTGRNRVLIARRTLPWPMSIAHVLTWLVVGTWRAPEGDCRRAYLRGWLSGWRCPVARKPIRWATVWTLTRLGRPPIV